MDKKQEKINLYFEMNRFIVEMLWLKHWTINIDSFKDWAEWEGAFWVMEEADHFHFTAKIRYNDCILKEEIKEDFKEIFEMFLHEILHIFCWTWTCYFDNNQDDLEKAFTKDWFEHRRENVLICEEQMVTVLAKNFTPFFEWMDEYKEFENTFNNFKKCLKKQKSEK